MASLSSDMSEHTTIVYARGRYDGLLLGLLALSLAGNLGFGYAWLRAERVPSAAPSNTPRVGTKLPAPTVQQLDGTATTLVPQGGEIRTVLYVFTPTCQWCERNLDNLRAISAAAKEKKFRLVGISLDPGVDETYMTSNQLDIPVFVATTEMIRAYGLGATPETFVVTADGTLEQHWRGAFSGPTKRSVESWLGRALPGITKTVSD